MSQPSLLRRLRTMDRRELAARTGGALRVAGERLSARARPAAWRRRDLAARLVPLTPDLGHAREWLAAGEWTRAHAALCRHFAGRAPRFVLHPSARDGVRRRILAAHPHAAGEAHAMAARIAAGWYDLLGYEDLRFGDGAEIDWHLDPVSQRRAPRVFWADVRYLDPSAGDHKVIWELNRHQEWLMLGRARWLTEPDPAGRHGFADTFTSQLAGWMEANPPGIGINWASSLELAFRSISWLWALEMFAAPARERERPWTIDLLLGLERQVRHIERHLSLYFSPNTHLLGEALALYVCGLALPELASAGRWAALGRRLLIDQAVRQVLPDGVHAERSPHYHRYALDFYLLALAMARLSRDRGTVDRLRPVVIGMAEFMRDISDDEGRYPQIGDDDGGELAPVAGRAGTDARATLGWSAALLGRPDLAVHPQPEAVVWLTALTGDTPYVAGLGATRRTASRSAAYPAAGYFISRHGASHLVFGAGPHGFLNGGHAHADALSVTLAGGGHPLLVDSGTGTYTMDSRLRNQLRSSDAHNTLTLDGRSQSVPAGPFHWHSRADASPGRIVRNLRFDYFEGSCDAYAPLVHERLVLSLDDGRWIVADRVTGEGRHEAALHWHVDPAWRAVLDGRGGVCLFHESGARACLAVAGAPIDVLRRGDGGRPGCVSPVYGRLEAATTLRSHVIRRTPIALATLIDAGVPPRGLVPRLAEVLSDRADEAAFAVIATGTDLLEVTLFAGSPPDTRTVVLDARRGLSITTDARLLYARVDGGGRLARLSVVDCSLARFEGACPVTLTAPAPVGDLDLTMPPDGPRQISLSRGQSAASVHVEVGDDAPAIRASALAPGGRSL